MTFATQIAGGAAPDVAFRVAPDTALPAETLRVDYDLGRLQGVAGRWRCCELSDLAGPLRHMIMEASSRDPYAQLRFDLAVAASLLQPDGQLRLLLRERKIARRLTAFAAEAFAATDVHSGRGVIEIRCGAPRPLRPEPPYGPAVTVDDPEIGRRYVLRTWPGLFSGDALDPGSALLLQHLPPLQGRTVLDVGCGYGPLAVVAAGRGAQVVYADVDARAIRQTTENLTAAGSSGRPLLSHDLGELKPNSVDFVISNPPTHAGSGTLRTLFERMLAVCRPGGDVRMVLRRHLNYEKWMGAYGVETIDDREGYKVLRLTSTARDRC
jgi:16S rRNA (guanine1207-N2)-methyltransferase